MSSRYERDGQFETGMPDVSMQEWNDFSAGSEVEMMRGLQLASDTVMRLATQTHAAVARGDAVAAEAARIGLQAQLSLTTRLIDELLFDGADTHTTH
jgi:hypothetical protein